MPRTRRRTLNALAGRGSRRPTGSGAGTTRRQGLRRRLRSRPLRKERVLEQIRRGQRRKEAEKSKAAARQSFSALLHQIREPEFQTALHSSVRKHLEEIHFGDKPEKLPGPEVVKAVAFDLVMLYAGMTKLRKGDLEKLKNLAEIELDPTVSSSKKSIDFRDIIGRGNKLFEEIREMEDRAHTLAEKDRLAKTYQKNSLSGIAKGFMVKASTGKRHFVSKEFATLVVERAAQTASITLADLWSTLKLVKGKPLEAIGEPKVLDWKIR